MTRQTLKLGPNLSLPLEAVTQTFGILAKRGVGKTYTALVLVEEFLKAGQQVIVVDPVGVCWGLRASADGKSPGLPIIVLGGDHGDLPLEVNAGSTIADLAVDERLSLVLDLSAFRKGEQVRFMTDFAERLYHRNRQPLHIVLDEADMFAPQRPMKGRERMLGAVEDLVRRGRARGLGITLVTQRAAVLNKDVLTQVEVLVALRTIAPQDRDAIDAWVKAHGTPEERKKLMDSLPSLPIGTAWFWSPGWLDMFRRVKIRERDTFDSSATPKVGARIKTPKKLAPVDLERLRGRLTAAIERAQAEDPRLLHRRIGELKRDLAKAQKAKPQAAAKIERVEVPVLKDTQISRLEKLAQRLGGTGDKIVLVGRQIADAIASANGKKAGTTVVGVHRHPSKPSRIPQAASPAPIVSDSSVNLRRGERKILHTLARRFPVASTRSQVGTLSGYAARGGTFGNYFGVLKRHQFLEERTDGIVITEHGMAYLGLSEPPPPQTTEELLETWRSALRRGERQMLDELVRIYPDTITRDELGERAGYTASGGTFGNYLGVLRRNGLVEAEGGMVRASDALFMESRVE